MTDTQIKDYLKKYRIDSEEQLAKHIEELKRNTIPNNEIIFPLVDLLLNEKSVLNSFFAENKKQETITPFFLDEAVISYQSLENGKFKDNTVTYTSTRHKSKAGETHKEIVGDLEGINKPPKTLNGLQRYISELEQYKDDVITNSSRGEKDTIEYLQGVKETEGKLNYELDWEFIEQMAERMSQNKGKYKPYNWKRPMEIEKLKQSLFRHVVEVMKGNYSDDGREFGHFESIALNSMMINYQLKVK